MQTSVWGPQAWDTFFIFSRNYPYIINIENKEHMLIKKSTKEFYKSLIYILPCKYCRESYKIFWKKIPIDNHLNRRNDLTYWLYLIKDLVNKKLIEQEKIELDKQIKEGIFNKSYLKKKLLKTKKSPPFETILIKYDKFKAKCSDKTKTC